jgi:hypothetical protein
VQQQGVQPGERPGQRGARDDHAFGGEAELGHGGHGVDAVARHVADHEQRVPVGQFDGAEPVAADMDLRLRGQAGDFDAQSRQPHGCLRQRQQRVLEPGGRRPFGVQDPALQQDGPLALHQREFGAALRGEVLSRCPGSSPSWPSAHP